MKCSVGKVPSFRILQLVVLYGHTTYETEILRNSLLIKEESFTTELATNFTREIAPCAICFRQNYVVMGPVL